MMRPGRYDGFPRRVDGRPSADCCCVDGQCYQTSVWRTVCNNGDDWFNLYPKPSPVIYPRLTCARALIWKNAIWNNVDNVFTNGVDGPPIARGSITPDWTLRIATWCARGSWGHANDDPAWTKPNEGYDNLPVVSKCWDLNPCTGSGDSDGSCLDLYDPYESYWSDRLTEEHDGKRFALCIVAYYTSWFIKDGPYGARFRPLGPAWVDASWRGYQLTETEASEWDAAVLLPPVCVH